MRHVSESQQQEGVWNKRKGNDWSSWSWSRDGRVYGGAKAMAREEKEAATVEGGEQRSTYEQQDDHKKLRHWYDSFVPPNDLPSFVPGFEPSAPPLPPDSPPPHRPKRPADFFISVFRPIWQTSHTVLRLDLRRTLRVEGPVVGSREAPTRRPPRNSSRPAGRADGYGDDWESSSASPAWLRGIEGGGAQLKMMQIFDFPNKDTGEPRLPWNLNFGFGARIEVDRGGHLEPQIRVRADHVAVYVLPYPLLELRGKWPLGVTQLAINVHYRIPLLHLPKFWMSPTAQLRMNLFNPLGTGVHLSAGGLEFDEHVINIGEHTSMRIAAAIEFPREFPLKEGEQPIRVRVDRLGLKARIT